MAERGARAVMVEWRIGGGGSAGEAVEHGAPGAEGASAGWAMGIAALGSGISALGDRAIAAQLVLSRPPVGRRRVAGGREPRD